MVALQQRFGGASLFPNQNAIHADFEELSGGGCMLLDEGSEHTLPALALPEVVLMPGSTIPIKLSGPSDLSLLHSALHPPPPTTRLIVVVRQASPTGH